MKKIFSSIIASILIITIGLGIPQQQNQVHAGGLQNSAFLAQISANTGISATIDTATNARELADTIAWQVAKQMVSNMTRSLINWINSGFQGSPAFITDLDQFLIDALDQVAGEYIESLGGIGEFICSPFKLDVQAALAINYQQARSGMPSGGDESMCTVTGIASNIENFLSGTVDSWGDWLTVTSNPQNTPYGAYLEAEAQLNARLINAAGQELTMADWGNGFLSQEVCEPIEGTTQENCTVSTPGNLINEALNFQITVGPRSLIEADELNELISALVNQLALQMVQGINGLLGLSQKNPTTNSSYLDDAVNDVPKIDLAPYEKEMNTALALEVEFLSLINSTKASATIQGMTASSSSSTIRSFINELDTLKPQVTANIASTSELIARFKNPTSTTLNPKTSSNASSSVESIKQQVVLDFFTLQGSGALHTKSFIDSRRLYWDAILNGEEEN